MQFINLQLLCVCCHLRQRNKVQTWQLNFITIYWDCLRLNRLILYRDPFSWWSILMAPMHSGSYQDCPTELYFEERHPMSNLQNYMRHGRLGELQVRVLVYSILGFRKLFKFFHFNFLTLLSFKMTQKVICLCEYL